MMTGKCSSIIKTDIGECIYGFGEKFTPFVKNGQTVETWNCDGGTCSDQSYKTVPFYISSKSYGVFVNSSDKVSFEININALKNKGCIVFGKIRYNLCCFRLLL